jgi:hypothetical protein
MARTPILVLAASIMVGCGKKEPQEPAETRLDVPELTIVLPGGWIEKPRAHGYELSSFSHTKQLIVSITPMGKGDDSRVAVDRLVANESPAASPAGHATKPTYEEKAGVLYARFHGTDTQRGAFFSYMFIARKDEAVAVEYFEYGKSPSEADGERRAQGVFATLRLK